MFSQYAAVSPTGASARIGVLRRANVLRTASASVARSKSKCVAREIKKVLDAAVAIAVHDESLELLGDHGFPRIGKHIGAGRSRSVGVRAGARLRPHSVAEPHADLERQARGAAFDWELCSRADVVVFRANALDADRRGAEFHGVRLDGRGDDGANVVEDRFVRALTSTKEVEVARRSVGMLRPDAQKPRP